MLDMTEDPGMDLPSNTPPVDHGGLTNVTTVNGRLSEVPPAKVLKMFCQGTNSGCVIFLQGLMVGKIFVEQGRVVDAELSQENGEEVFKQLLLWDKGKFYFKSSLRAEVITIERPWEEIYQELMDAFSDSGDESPPSA